MFDCSAVTQCSDYSSNQRACDYDPCNIPLGCYWDETSCESGVGNSLKPSSSFFSSIMNFFKGMLTGNVIKEITKDVGITGNAVREGNSVLENNGIVKMFNESERD